MKTLLSIRLGIVIILTLILVMAFSSIYVFTRMSPAIEIIIQQNERSLLACEEMLFAMLYNDLTVTSGNQGASVIRFEQALNSAINNITEPEEPEILDAIQQSYKSALAGDAQSRIRLMEGIASLSAINRDAMYQADVRARRLGTAGAWSVVFITLFVVVSTLIFRNNLFSRLIIPVNELKESVEAFLQGDIYRRCNSRGHPKDIQQLFSNVNELLDNTLPNQPDINPHRK